MLTQEIIEAAERTIDQADMRTSAELCIKDAKEQLAAGNEAGARRWALKALRYTVGILSPIYQQAQAA